MKPLKFILLITGTYLLQTMIMSKFAIFGVRPDLLLIVTTLFAVLNGPEEGFFMGLFCGLVQDVFGFGFYYNTISKALLGFLVGTFKESVLGTEETVAVSAVTVATLTSFIVELMIMFFFFGKPVASPGILLISLIIACIYNSLLSPVFYLLIKAMPGLAEG